jgi:O-antigen/teichoic acid export membrane protein
MADGLGTAVDGPLETDARAFAANDARRRQSTEPFTRVARNVGALSGGQLVTWTMTLMWTLIVPRALGPIGLGIVVSAQSISGVLGIVLGLGTRNYLVREIVINREQGPKLVGTALVLRLMLAPVVGLGAVAWAHVANYGQEASAVLYLITAMTILTLLAEPMQATFQAIEQMQYLAYADVINKSAQSLIGIALVIVGFRAIGIAADMAVMAGVVGLLSLLWLRPLFRIDLRTSIGRMTSMARESLAYWAFGLFGYVYLWIDTIMLSLMTQYQVVGWYGASTRLFQTLMFIPVIVSTAWLPRLVAAFAKGHPDLLKAARTPLEVVLLLSIPVAVGTAMVAPVLIHVVYGSEFANAVPVMIILAACIPPIYLNIMLAQVLLAAKRQAVWTIVMAGAAVANPRFNLVLIPLTQSHYRNGAIGAAVSLVLTEVLMDIIGLILVGPKVFDRRALRRFALTVAAAGGMWIVAYAARPLGGLISIGAGVVTLALLTLVLRIPSSDEIQLVRAGLARLRPKRLTA